MPDLRIQTNIDNGDLPEQLELFEDQDPKQFSLFDIFDKERLKEFLNERDNKQFHNLLTMKKYLATYCRRVLTFFLLSYKDEINRKEQNEKR